MISTRPLPNTYAPSLNTGVYIPKFKIRTPVSASESGQRDQYKHLKTSIAAVETEMSQQNTAKK